MEVCGVIDMASNRSRRRWLALSLRAMLVVILAIAVWLGWWVNSSHNQQVAVAAVESDPFSAGVIYDDVPDYFPQDVTAGLWLRRKVTSWLPAFIEARLGKDFFHSVLAVAFSRRDDGTIPNDEA